MLQETRALFTLKALCFSTRGTVACVRLGLEEHEAFRLRPHDKICAEEALLYMVVCSFCINLKKSLLPFMKSFTCLRLCICYVRKTC